MGTALLEIRIIALLEVRIITLLVRVAEALLAVILLLSIALLLAAGLITILLITAIACAVLLLIASAVFQAVIESRIGNFHIRGNIKSGDTAGSPARRYQRMKERSNTNLSILCPYIMALLSLMHSIMPLSGFSANM